MLGRPATLDNSRARAYCTCSRYIGQVDLVVMQLSCSACSVGFCIRNWYAFLDQFLMLK